jgi:hypothetical protein
VVEWLVQEQQQQPVQELELVDTLMMQELEQQLVLVQMQWQAVVLLVQQVETLQIILQSAKSILILNHNL